MELLTLFRFFMTIQFSDKKENKSTRIECQLSLRGIHLNTPKLYLVDGKKY
jgi:hypothetical protein